MNSTHCQWHINHLRAHNQSRTEGIGALPPPSAVSRPERPRLAMADGHKRVHPIRFARRRQLGRRLVQRFISQGPGGVVDSHRCVCAHIRVDAHCFLGVHMGR